MLSPKRYLPYALIFVILSYFMPLYAQSGLDSAADPGTDPGKAESKSEPAQPSSLPPSPNCSASTWSLPVTPSPSVAR